jgi:hypothetical protein
MEFKGTQGRWYAFKLRERFVVGNKEGSLFHFIDCWLNGIGGIESDEEANANAVLISKAPQMLEMLQNQLEFLIYCRDNMKVSRPVFNQKIVRLEKLIKEATEV